MSQTRPNRRQRLGRLTLLWLILLSILCQAGLVVAQYYSEDGVPLFGVFTLMITAVLGCFVWRGNIIARWCLAGVAVVGFFVACVAILAFATNERFLIIPGLLLMAVVQLALFWGLAFSSNVESFLKFQRRRLLGYHG